jgi:dimethylargininase
MLIAITREVSPSITRCELTHLQRQPIDLERARMQHLGYESTLAKLGCRVAKLPVEPDLPDSVFVEDTAVVFNETALITRPGAASRRPETHGVALALLSYRELAFIEEPGTVDGGDVLCVGKKVYIGISQRTNLAGIEQVRAALKPFGYTVHGVQVKGCLHLKSAVTPVGPDTLLINRRWVERGIFKPLQVLDVDPLESHGANALWFGGKVMYSPAFPRTAKRLEKRGIGLELVDLSELAKAEGALTCCSLIFKQ